MLTVAGEDLLLHTLKAAGIFIANVLCSAILRPRSLSITTLPHPSQDRTNGKGHSRSPEPNGQDSSLEDGQVSSTLVPCLKEASRETDFTKDSVTMSSRARLVGYQQSPASFKGQVTRRCWKNANELILRKSENSNDGLGKYYCRRGVYGIYSVHPSSLLAAPEQTTSTTNAATHRYSTLRSCLGWFFERNP